MHGRHAEATEILDTKYRNREAKARAGKLVKVIAEETLHQKEDGGAEKHMITFAVSDFNWRALQARAADNGMSAINYVRHLIKTDIANSQLAKPSGQRNTSDPMQNLVIARDHNR